MLKRLIACATGCLFPGAIPAEAAPDEDIKASFDLAALIQPVPRTAKFIDEKYFTWGGSVVKGDDGRYHMFYSRWLRKDGFFSWVTRSEIAHAVSGSPLGPFRFRDVALPKRGAQYWDGLVTHNPTIKKFGRKYYLYYSGNTGNNVLNKKQANLTHRHNQQIGVAIATSPNGPWKRFDKPIIAKNPDIGADDHLLCTNPTVTRKPDGKYLMIYKASAKRIKTPVSGPIYHLTAEADRPEGPFIKKGIRCFEADPSIAFPAEDPNIWCQDGVFYAILKDFHGTFTGKGRSLVLFISKDGLHWKLPEHCFIANPEITWADGSIQKFARLERPQIFLENGRPAVLYCAALLDKEHSQSMNIHIPIAPPPNPKAANKGKNENK